MFQVKKTEKIENDSSSSLETENSSQPRKSLFFTYSPLSQEFLQKKNLMLYVKTIKQKMMKIIYSKLMDFGINLNIINL